MIFRISFLLQSTGLTTEERYLSCHKLISHYWTTTYRYYTILKSPVSLYLHFTEDETGKPIDNNICLICQKRIEIIQRNQTLTRGTDVSGDVVGRQLKQVVRQVFHDFRHQVSEVSVVLHQVHLQRHRCRQQQRQSNDVSDLHGVAEVSKLLYIGVSKYRLSSFPARVIGVLSTSAISQMSDDRRWLLVYFKTVFNNTIMVWRAYRYFKIKTKSLWMYIGCSHYFVKIFETCAPSERSGIPTYIENPSTPNRK